MNTMDHADTALAPSEAHSTLPALQLRARSALWGSVILGGGAGLAGGALLLPALLAAIPSGWLQQAFGLHGGVVVAGLLPLLLFLPAGLLIGLLVRAYGSLWGAPVASRARLAGLAAGGFGAAGIAAVLVQSGGSLWFLRGLGSFVAATAAASGLLGLVATSLPAPPERPAEGVGLLQGLLVGGVVGSLGFMVVTLASLAEDGSVILLLSHLWGLGPWSWLLFCLVCWLPVSLLFVPAGWLLRRSRSRASRRSVLVGAVGSVALALGLFVLGELFGSPGGYLPPGYYLTPGALAGVLVACLVVVGWQALCLGLALGPGSSARQLPAHGSRGRAQELESTVPRTGLEAGGAGEQAVAKREPSGLPAPPGAPQ